MSKIDENQERNMDIQMNGNTFIKCPTKIVFRPRPKVVLEGRYRNELSNRDILTIYHDIIEKAKFDVGTIIIKYDRKRGKDKGIHVRYNRMPGSYGWRDTHRKEFDLIKVFPNEKRERYYLDDDGNMYGFKTLEPIKEE